MNCAGCGSEVQSSFAFCPKCGAKQPNACPGCGYVCASDFMYCPKCGAQLEDAVEAGNQRKPSSPTIPATVPIGVHTPAPMPTPGCDARRDARPPPPTHDRDG